MIESSSPISAEREAHESERRSCRARARPLAWLLAASSCLAWVEPAAAQKPAADPREAKAQALFEAGVDGMRAGDYGSACPKLAESHALSPSLGALFTLAECEAAWGKVATAVERYQSFVNELTALKQSRRDKFEERSRKALEKIAALTPLAPELTVDVPAASPGGLVLKRNGSVVDPSEYGVARKVDPGDYVLGAEVQGKLVWERRIKLSQRDRARVDVPLLDSSTPGLSGSASSPLPEGDGSAARTWGYVVGGVGALGLATGIVAGSIALGQKGTIDDNCPELTCNAEGRSAVTTGQTSALVSTVSFPIGLAGLAGATILFLVASPEVDGAKASRGLRPGVIAADRGAIVSLEGAF